MAPQSRDADAAVAAVGGRDFCSITTAVENRFTLFPIHDEEIYGMWTKSKGSYWTPEEVDMADDVKHWELLKKDEQHFIKHTLAFFAASDGIVMENLAMRFSNDVFLPELRLFYASQINIEAIHSETYSLLIDALVREPAEKQRLFDAVATMPVIARKAEWARRWIASNDSFGERLVAFACVEGIQFSSSFASIFWLKKRGLMPGLSFSNELISRDEGLHRDLAVLVHKRLARPASEETVRAIVREAVDLEVAFACDALPVSLIGMNSDHMSEYIRFVADHLLVSMGYSKEYGAKNPFDWMELISLLGKTNFFEKRNGDYAKANVAASRAAGPGAGGVSKNYEFTKDEDF